MSLMEIINKLISGLSGQETSTLEAVSHCGTAHTRR